jgi:GntR family transcriptional regulator
METINRDNPTPLYQQIRFILSNLIFKGELLPGDPIPTERELCERYGVSRITAIKALDEMERQGLINRIQGKGSIVAIRSIDSTKTVAGLTELVRAQGMTTRAKLLASECISGSSRMKLDFQLPVDSEQQFYHFRRLRYVNEHPVVILDTYVLREVGERMLEHDLATTSFYRLYEDIFQRKISHAESTLYPIVATPEIQDLLQCERDTAHFLSQGISYLEGDIPVEVTTGLYHGNWFRYTAIKPALVAIKSH